MKITPIQVLGMDLICWKYKSCKAEFAVEDSWATLYGIRSLEKGKGHATELLIAAKEFYEGQGKKFGGSIALSPAMSRIYQKLGIEEYKK